MKINSISSEQYDSSQGIDKKNQIKEANLAFNNMLQYSEQTESREEVQQTDSLLLLLQGTTAYTGYIESIIEQDILTEAERQYLLTGDIERIEKKSIVT